MILKLRKLTHGQSCILFLVVLVVITYRPIVENGFTLDDRAIVLDNKLFSEGRWRDIISTGYWEGAMGTSESKLAGLYRPATTAFLAAQFFIFGKSPVGYHVVSLTLHLSVVVLLFLTGCRFMSKEAAWISASLFAIHPANSEAVNAIVGQADLIVTVTGLGALLVFDKTRELFLTKESENKWRYVFAASVLLFIAQMAKENGAIVSLALVFSCVSAHKLWKVCVVAISGTAIALLIRSILFGSFTIPGIGFIDNPLAYTDTVVRILNAPAILIRYVLKMLYPWPLVADYSYDAIPTIHAVAILDFIFPMAFVLSSVVLLITIKHKVCSVYKSLSWQYLTCFNLVLASHVFVALGTIFAERLLYLPTCGLCLLLGWCANRFRSANTWAYTRNLVLTGLVFAYSNLSTTRSRAWIDDRTLFSDGTSVMPRSARNHFGLGLALQREGDMIGALQSYNKALTIYPRYVEAHYNQGAAFVELSRYEEALHAYRAAEKYRPNYRNVQRTLELLTQHLSLSPETNK